MNPDRPQPTVTRWIKQLINAEVREEECPDWLTRPGRRECRELWPLVQEIYAHLTGQTLPEIMSPKEKRRIDIVLAYPDGTQQFLEVDERQHFNPWRALTLDHYPIDTPLGFPREVWKERALSTPPRSGGGWARPKPPLFPEPGGRHQQRAFRDMVADLLPSQYGFRPTLRVSDRDVTEWQKSTRPLEIFSEVLIERGLPAEFVVITAETMA
jgi:hypothetical protein